ncbi:hypothetical protein [Pseudoxanthomonas sp. Root65]|uniref:HzsA-related protein n=1 Tax=Pseudoxanthomonas sp. Root65 TaxID=1736576 RepID=UPI000B22ED61|nr:hypothetical protein [Pseudoxanthomonas sp. Root65]
MLLAACGGGSGDAVSNADSPSTGSGLDSAGDVVSHGRSGSASASLSAAEGPIPHPILFVTQIPTPGDPFASRLSTFANHIPNLDSVPRGGDLMIRYPNGTLRNLTQEAGFGMEGLQTAEAIAVREPTVHWDGNKAIFSMLVGAAPKQYQSPKSVWQLYEVTGLAAGANAVITKVANQPQGYNNVSPLYASDDRILFTSDRPMGGLAHLYPHLDEYESTPTISGIYALNPASGELKLLNHTPSGAFTPTIDSFGRLIFTRWDHLQRDQQAEGDTYKPRNYASEATGAEKLPQQNETFPESRNGMESPYGDVNGFTTNLFTPWQMNQDGTGELTLNHIGRQELAYLGYVGRTFVEDPSLRDGSNDPPLFQNRKQIREDGGIFHVREDPSEAGTYYGIYAREFGSLTTDQIVRFNGGPSLNAEQMVFSNATPANLNGGRYRNPLPMSSGHIVASYTMSPVVRQGIDLRLHAMTRNGDGTLALGDPLTSGIHKTISWWSPDAKLNFSGNLWEIEPVEVVARQRPAPAISTIDPIEKAVLVEENVDEAALRAWLVANKLALIVTRNQTSRDRGDKQQPFNLGVPGGVKTVGNTGKVYAIQHYQILQGNQVRSYDNFNKGRRTIAQPMEGSLNPQNPGGPAGSVRIAADGSTAAFVPSNRALTWQTTDSAGEPIVRERVWVTLQSGEIRTCAGCHGENSRNQAGHGAPLNKPEALREILRYWKQRESGPIRVNGSQPLVRQ